jgi:hypothetical protein
LTGCVRGGRDIMMGSPAIQSPLQSHALLGVHIEFTFVCELHQPRPQTLQGLNVDAILHPSGLPEGRHNLFGLAYIIHVGSSKAFTFSQVVRCAPRTREPTPHRHPPLAISFQLTRPWHNSQR